MAFKDRFRELEEIFRELQIVRERNLELTKLHGKWVPGYLAFAEGLLVLLGLERFLRVILGSEATMADTLPGLVKKATSTPLDLVTLPPWWPRDQTIAAMKNVRNAVVHGNFEQAALQSGCESREDYFRTGTYINEVDTLRRILDGFCSQIDPETGKPRNPRPPWSDPRKDSSV